MLIFSFQLRKQVADISLESLKIFSYVDIDGEYQRYISFTYALFCICINSSNTIINNPDVIGKKDVFLLNNITELLLLGDQIIF